MFLVLVMTALALLTRVVAHLGGSRALGHRGQVAHDHARKQDAEGVLRIVLSKEQGQAKCD